MAIHSSILARIIPWTEEPGGLLSVGLQRVSCTLASKQHNNIFADTSFLLFNSQLCKYKVVFHCGFDLHFPND